MLPTRRAVLAGFLATATLPIRNVAAAQAQQGAAPLPLTPDCRDGHESTRAQTEGPYFKPSAPQRRDLAADSPKGERITLAGFVLDTACRPVPTAQVQIWHADETGAYDNSGFKFRGYQYTDDSGRCWVSTIVPAAYPGRTKHYHFKVQRPGARILTTQLYFPDEPLNRRDGLFDERLLLRVRQAADGAFGRSISSSDVQVRTSSRLTRQRL